MTGYKKRILSALLAASLLLPCAYTLSADDGRGEFDPYAWEISVPTADLSRRMSDYTGAGEVIAVIDSGFDLTHPVFETAPPSPAIARSDVARLFGEAYYISEKIPFAFDYAGGAGNLGNLSSHGTSAASVAGGFKPGAGDQHLEDGTVLHDPTVAGMAPDAQLLLMKAAADGSSRIDASMAAQAILDALRLGAAAIVIHTDGLTENEDLLTALDAAAQIGVPVFCGAGDVNTDTVEKISSVLYTDRSTLSAICDLPGLSVVGAAGDPYRNIRTLRLRIGEGEETPVAYTDSCSEYFGIPFAGYFAGMDIPVCWIEGVGRAEDYRGIDAEGKLAVVRRGEISFVEKATHASEAGAIGFIVVDSGDGVSRMALEGAPIPGVMVDKEAEAILADAGAVLATFPKLEKTVAAFSASGVDGSLSKTVDFVCDGEGLMGAIHTALAEDTVYAELSGTSYAAAAAAGFAARCAQFCRKSGLTQADVLPLLIQSADPLRDEDGHRLSPRMAGAGYVSEDSVFPASCMVNEDGRSVTVAGALPYRTAYLSLTVKNLGDTEKKYTITGAVYSDGWVEKEGIPTRDGKSEILSAAVYLGDSTKNIHEGAENRKTVTLTLDPGEVQSLDVRVNLSKAQKKSMDAVFENGFFMDGFLILTEEGGEVLSHPFTAFFGDWSKAPLVDSLVYDPDPAVLAKSYLTFRPDEDNDHFIGVKNPASVGWDVYDPRYNILDADGDNTLYLHLSVLRKIDSLRVRIFDAGGRCVYEREEGDLSWQTRKTHAIPLWNFVAGDNEEYLFPEGEYECEIRLKSSFGKLGSTENEMNFKVTLDRDRPDVVSYSIAREKAGRLTLRVTATDDRALGILYAYDGGFSYVPEGGMYAFSGEKTAYAVMDLSQYDYLDPLYIEVSDYAGNSRVIRIPSEKIKALSGVE